MKAMDYNLDWLIERFDNEGELEYLFFWGHTNKHGEEVGKFVFSQWFDLPFIVDDISYKTAEHWMMAQKALLFDDKTIFNKIINSALPGEVKKLGRQVYSFNEEMWNQHRFEIVKLGNIHKFNQHPKAAEYLLNTGEKILVETSPVDTIWGIGMAENHKEARNPRNWRGLNLLGFALMYARNFLIEFGHFSQLNLTIDLPWKIYPGIDPMDMHWRMGKGEELIEKFCAYYSTLSDREKMILKIIKPAPFAWSNFYDK